MAQLNSTLVHAILLKLTVLTRHFQLPWVKGPASQDLFKVPYQGYQLRLQRFLRVLHPTDYAVEVTTLPPREVRQLHVIASDYITEENNTMLAGLYDAVAGYVGVASWYMMASFKELENATQTSQCLEERTQPPTEKPPVKVLPPEPTVYEGMVQNLVGQGGLIQVLMSEDGQSFLLYEGGNYKWVKVDATIACERDGPVVDLLLNGHALYRSCPAATTIKWRHITPRPTIPAITVPASSDTSL